MSLVIWTRVLYIACIVIYIFALITSYRFGMKYFNICMSVLRELVVLRAEGKINSEVHRRLLDAMSPDKNKKGDKNEKKEC